MNKEKDFVNKIDNKNSENNNNNKINKTIKNDEEQNNNNLNRDSFNFKTPKKNLKKVKKRN